MKPNTSILYRVADWGSHFETAETRKLKNLDWWPKPNKHDGLGFRKITASRDRIDLYCAWNLICDIASKTQPKEQRGILARDGKPLDAEDMSLMTGFPANIFQKALNFFPQLGWIIAVELSEPHPEAGDSLEEPDEATQRRAFEAENGLFPESAVIAGESAGVAGKSPAEGKGREGTEENGKEPPSALVFPQKLNTEEFKEVWTRWEKQRRGFKKPKGNWEAMFQEQLNWLNGFSEFDARGVLLASLRNGWQGLFEPKPAVGQAKPKGGTSVLDCL